MGVVGGNEMLYTFFRAIHGSVGARWVCVYVVVCLQFGFFLLVVLGFDV